MTHQLLNAAIRCVIALILVIVWVVFYEGPPWAWLLLITYVVFTIGMSYVIDRKIQAAKARAQKEDET